MAAQELRDAVAAAAPGQGATPPPGTPVVGERRDRRVARLGRLFQRSLHDAIEVAAQRAPQRRQVRAARGGDSALDLLEGARTRACQRAGQRLGVLLDYRLRPTDVATLG